MRQSFSLAGTLPSEPDSIQPLLLARAGNGMPSAFRRCTLTTASRSTWMLPKRADFTLKVFASIPVTVPYRRLPSARRMLKASSVLASVLNRFTRFSTSILTLKSSLNMGVRQIT